MEKKKKKKHIIYNICLIILIGVFVGSAAYLAVYFYKSARSEKEFEELADLIDQPVDDSEIAYTATDGDAEPGLRFVSVDGVLVQERFAALYQKNQDFIGWLSIEDTNINYPVMLTEEDEEYYIHRNFDGETDSAGTLFLDTESDAKTPSDNVLIYGHNMKSGTMFHDLLKYEDEDFYRTHKYIQFDTIYGNATYEVIAAFRTKIDESADGFQYYNFFTAENEEAYDAYVANCQSLTGYQTDASASYGDKLITLSTCAYHTDNGRFVVVAKRLRQ